VRFLRVVLQNTVLQLVWHRFTNRNIRSNEVGESMGPWNVGILPQHTTRSHNSEDHDLKLHRRENLKTRNCTVFFVYW